MSKAWRDGGQSADDASWAPARSPGKQSLTAPPATDTRSSTPGKRTLTESLGVQRKSTGGPAAMESPVEIANRGVATAADPLPHAAAIQASFGRHDVSHVRAATGGAAAESSQGLGASAYAIGARVGFAASPDLHTAAHEAAHVVQQRAGVQLHGGIDGGAGDPYERHADAVADRVVRGKSAEALLDPFAGGRSNREVVQRKTDLPQGMVNARKYLDYNAYVAGEAIGLHLIHQRLPEPHPRMEWRNEKLFYEKLFYGLSGILKFKSPFDVAQLLAPGDPYGLVDQLRPITKAVEDPDSKDDMKGGPVGPWAWSAPVGLAIAQLVEQTLIDSLYRLGPRWVAAADTLQGKGDVEPEAIARSHPMDRFVVGPMCKPGVFQWIAEASSKTSKPAAKRDPGVKVALTWVGKDNPELWNWVRASPADATVEEVSAALFEYMTTKDHESRADYYATFLTAAPPMFGIPPQWAKTFEETRGFRPATIPGADSDPDHQIVALGGARLSDDQAIAEIGGAAPDPKAKATPHPAGEHDNLVADASAQATVLRSSLSAWKMGEAADNTLGFLARRRADGADGAKWLPVLTAQRENLTRISTGILQLDAAVDQMKLKRTGAEAEPLREIMRFYADATATAHLDKSCNRLILRAANAQTSLTARGLASSLRDMDMSVDMMRTGVGASDYDRLQVSNTAVHLRDEATAMQTKLMRGGKVDPDAIEDLQIRAEETSLDAKLVAVEFSLHGLESAADEAGVGLAAWFAALFSSEFRDLKGATQAIRDHISDIRYEWDKAKRNSDMPDDDAQLHVRANLRKAVDKAKTDFDALAHKAHINRFLREGANTVKWQQFRTACVKLAALIGISLVGGFVGGMVARGVAGMMMGTGGAAAMESLSLGGAVVARGAGMVAETAIQSAGQSLIFDDHFGTAFLENMIMNLGSAGVLKALGSKVEEAAKVEKAMSGFWQKTGAVGKVVIKETAAITGHAIMGVAMGYVAHKIVTGKTQPPPETLEEWMLQGAGIAVGRYVGKAMEASHARQQRLKLKGFEPSTKLAAQTEKLTELSKRVEQHPEAKDAMELLEKRHAHLTDELKLLEDIEKSPELMKQSGMTKGDLKTTKAAIAHQLADVHAQGFGDVPLHLSGMTELIPGVLWSGTPKQIEAAIHTARESGIDIKAKPDPQGGKWHLEIEGRKIEVEQRFEGREQPYDRKDVGAHPVPGSKFVGIRPPGEPKPRFTEHEIVPLTQGAVEILNLGEQGDRHVMSMGDNRLLITNGAKQIRAKIVIGEPMPQVATHDYTPGVKEPVTITVSKEANLHDITRATAHEIAEIQKLLVDPNAVHDDALKKGSTSEALTGHDEGRLAELKVLLYELDNVSDAGRRTEIKSEIDALLDHTGIDKQTVANDQRAKNILGPDSAKRVDQLANKRIKIKRAQVKVDDGVHGQEWTFSILAEVPGFKEPQLLGQGHCMLDPKGQPLGGPDFSLDKRVKLGGSEHRVDVEGIPSLTDFALEEANAAFAKRFGHPPTELPGSLGDDNKAIFQRKYIEEIEKGVDPKAAEQLAAAETPYVKARVKFGYKDIHVDIVSTRPVVMGVPPRTVTAPFTIHVTARKAK
jgi:hypothetical protein